MVIDSVHLYDIVHVYKRRERERERGVPADLSVKMLGLVSWAALLLSCSKQCCQVPPVQKMPHGKGRQWYIYTVTTRLDLSRLQYCTTSIQRLMLSAAEGSDLVLEILIILTHLPHSQCVEWASSESRWSCKAVQQHHSFHSATKEVQCT